MVAPIYEGVIRMLHWNWRSVHSVLACTWLIYMGVSDLRYQLLCFILSLVMNSHNLCRNTILTPEINGKDEKTNMVKLCFNLLWTKPFILNETFRIKGFGMNQISGQPCFITVYNLKAYKLLESNKFKCENSLSFFLTLVANTWSKVHDVQTSGLIRDLLIVEIMRLSHSDQTNDNHYTAHYKLKMLSTIQEIRK